MPNGIAGARRLPERLSCLCATRTRAHSISLPHFSSTFGELIDGMAEMSGHSFWRIHNDRHEIGPQSPRRAWRTPNAQTSCRQPARLPVIQECSTSHPTGAEYGSGRIKGVAGTALPHKRRSTSAALSKDFETIEHRPIVCSLDDQSSIQLPATQASSFSVVTRRYPSPCTDTISQFTSFFRMLEIVALSDEILYSPNA